MEDNLLTAEQVTHKLGFTNINTIWRLARARKIDIVVIGRRRMFTQEAVDKFIREHTLEAKEK